MRSRHSRGYRSVLSFMCRTDLRGFGRLRSRGPATSNTLLGCSETIRLTEPQPRRSGTGGTLHGRAVDTGEPGVPARVWRLMASRMTSAAALPRGSGGRPCRLLKPWRVRRAPRSARDSATAVPQSSRLLYRWQYHLRSRCMTSSCVTTTPFRVAGTWRKRRYDVPPCSHGGVVHGSREERAGSDSAGGGFVTCKV